ncbi:MAG: M43 family zinc metalloprotease [Ferruginibacter sp.]
MRRTLQLLTVIIFVMAGSRSSSQTLKKSGTNHYQRCYTVERAEEFKRTHPGAETDAQFEAWLAKKIKARKDAGLRPAFANYTIPIVFHVIHNGEAPGTSPNLDAGYIQEQLIQLNKDFANASNSRYQVAAATGIQFVLAQNDPTANPLAEPGIDRINRTTKGWNDYTNGWDISYIDGTVKPGSVWDANRYFNVWIIPALNGIGTLDILGYATLPATSGLQGLNNNETANTAGVVVLTPTIGSAFFPSNCGIGYGLGKTLTHETGHFFGLRHIWGDANCGTDYCDDTPIHFTSNSGVPTHPKSNSCGTGDEMFENYMDYSDDIVLNTFTAGQVDRMQTVMLNSPRRLSLSTSNVGGVSISGSNRIAFTNCTGELDVPEKGVFVTYPRFKDVSLTLNAEDVATDAATVTVSTTGTAVNGVDYQLLTPTLNFAAGDNFKSVDIRIFDNPRVEADRTIIVNYTVAGTGVTKGTDAQTVTINLLDDDNMRVGENPINLLDEHFETPVGGLGLPAGWVLLTSNNGNYVNKFVGSANGDAGGSGNSAHITNNTTTKPNTYTKGVSGVAVLKSPLIDASSVVSLGNLSFTYKVRGLNDNDDAILTYSTPSAPVDFYFYGNNGGLTGYGPYSSNTATITNAPVISAPSTLQNKKFNICYFWETSTLTTGGDPGFNVDDIVLSATPFHVETAVSNSYRYDIQGGINVNNFKSLGNEKAMVTIVNPSANITALGAFISQAGTGTVGITTTAGTFLRTQKVFQVNPEPVISTPVTYQATFYFTEAELAVWGADKLNLKIMKVQDGVALNSTLSSANTEIVTPTVFEDAAAGYITYTGTFTGFSQFVLVSPLTSLPVTFTSFQATPLQKSIQLIWNTSQEVNNRGFIIERSQDGSNFTQIGWVKGNGTSSIAATWNYTDNYVQRGITYYYRLKQVDIDNKQSQSMVRNARLKPGVGISISVTPNPAKDYVNLFITGTTNRATVELINPLGQKLIQQNDVNAANGVYNLPLRGLARGVYTVVVYLPEGAFAKKIIVQ